MLLPRTLWNQGAKNQGQFRVQSHGGGGGRTKEEQFESWFSVSRGHGTQTKLLLRCDWVVVPDSSFLGSNPIFEMDPLFPMDLVSSQQPSIKFLSILPGVGFVACNYD